MTDLEIAVTSARGALVAREAGATRVELCTALELGGVTPSAGLLDSVLDAVGAAAQGWQGVHVLVRPRPGGFAYDADELATAEREIRAVLAAGAAGVVVGTLTPQGHVDVPALRRLVAVARSTVADTTITFHRALDQSASVRQAFDELLAGLDGDRPLVDRVLTSGGAARAGDAADVLAELVRRGSGRLQVMAGGGVDLASVPALVAAGVDAVHLSAKRQVPGSGAVALGVDDAGGHFETDGDVVAAAARLLGPGVSAPGGPRPARP